MKGILFNLLADVVRREHGENTWDLLLDTAGLDGAYTSLGNYPDSDMMKLVAVASSVLKVPPDDVVRWFGRASLPLLAQQFPDFFRPHRDTRSFLLTLNDLIHPEVRKLYPGAEAPHFDYDTSSDDVLLMGYVSTRHLCAFGEGLIEGAAAHFNEQVRLDQPQCSKRGDPKCIFRISFTKT
jgi:hypothetical protein